MCVCSASGFCFLDLVVPCCTLFVYALNSVNGSQRIGAKQHTPTTPPTHETDNGVSQDRHAILLIEIEVLRSRVNVKETKKKKQKL